MDNQKKPEMPADDSWFDELLARPNVGSEIDADEQAVNAAGLSDLADMELEQIILETQNMEIPRWMTRFWPRSLQRQKMPRYFRWRSWMISPTS